MKYDHKGQKRSHKAERYWFFYYKPSELMITLTYILTDNFCNCLFLFLYLSICLPDSRVDTVALVDVGPGPTLEVENK